MIKIIAFDWANTIMRSLPEQGPMATWKHIELIPHIIEPLKHLKNENAFRLCVATGAMDSNAQMVFKALERGKIAHFFDFVFSSAEKNVAKTDISFYEIFCKEKNCAPEEVIMVGDNYFSDIFIPKQVGLNTIYFNEKRHKGNFPDADIVISSMKELLPSIERLTNQKK